MMNEYWIVTENKTGRIIAHCGDINDAIMMVAFDSENRSYSRQRFILDQVITVTSTTTWSDWTSCSKRTIATN